MNGDALVLVAEDDDGHFALVQRSMIRSGVSNPIVRFRDGQAIMNFLEDIKSPDSVNYCRALLLLLDIRMPKVGGLDVLSRIKGDDLLRRIPIIMLTTTDDRQAVMDCHRLGCNMYVVKPIEYQKFIEAVQEICHFFSILELPSLCLY